MHNAILVFFNKNVSIYKIRSKVFFVFKHQANHSAKRPHWVGFYFCFVLKVAVCLFFVVVVEFLIFIFFFVFVLNHVIHFPY